MGSWVRDRESRAGDGRALADRRSAFSRCALVLGALTLLFSTSRAHGQDVVVVPDGQPAPYAPPGYENQPSPATPGAGPYQLVPRYDPRTPGLYATSLAGPRTVERQTSIKALYIPGIIVFAASYSLSAAFGALSNSGEYSAWSAVPLIGPWVALGYASLDSEIGGSVFGGLMEAAGLVMFVLGLTLKRTVEVPVYSADPGDPLRGILTVRSVPVPAGGGIGLALTHG